MLAFSAGGVGSMPLSIGVLRASLAMPRGPQLLGTRRGGTATPLCVVSALDEIGTEAAPEAEFNACGAGMRLAAKGTSL